VGSTRKTADVDRGPSPRGTDKTGYGNLVVMAGGELLVAWHMQASAWSLWPIRFNSCCRHTSMRMGKYTRYLACGGVNTQGMEGSGASRRPAVAPSPLILACRTSLYTKGLPNKTARLRTGALCKFFSQPKSVTLPNNRNNHTLPTTEKPGCAQVITYPLPEGTVDTSPVRCLLISEESRLKSISCQPWILTPI
jgi:hypothetical protein